MKTTCCAARIHRTPLLKCKQSQLWWSNPMWMCASKARNYYQIIKRPIDLSVIRRKLDKANTLHYFSVEQFIDDVLLMFKNCATFNYVSSFFWFPERENQLLKIWTSDVWFLFFCRAAGLRSCPGWSEPGDFLPEPTEGGFSWPDVPDRQPGDDEQSPPAVALQEEGKLQEEEILLQGAKIQPIMMF